MLFHWIAIDGNHVATVYINSRLQLKSDKQRPSPVATLLRTEHENFSSLGSSLSKALVDPVCKTTSSITEIVRVLAQPLQYAFAVF